MRLRVDFIEYISKQIVSGLIAQGYITVKNPRALEEEVRGTIIDELSREDDLDEEVLDIIEAQFSKLPPSEREQIDVDEMFKLVKRQLAKERKLIL